MAISVFEKAVQIGVPREFAFQWHKAKQAFTRLLPPWEKVIVDSVSGGIDGGTVKLKTYVGPIPIRWTAEHSKFVENEQFFDKSVSGGPFSQWEHSHLFDAVNEQALGSASSTLLTDHIEYRLRGGGLASLVLGSWVKRKLQRMFEYRHAVTKSDLEDHFRFKDKQPKTIAITGASGLVGSALIPFLENGGHTVISLDRKNELPDGEIGWCPATAKSHLVPCKLSTRLSIWLDMGSRVNVGLNR